MLRRLQVEFAIVGDRCAEAATIKFGVLEDFGLVAGFDDVERAFRTVLYAVAAEPFTIK